MNCSLGEVEALCRKAARGAGLEWGHAEDAGRAARWLQARGLPGAQCLLGCFEAAPTARRFVARDGDWRGDDPLCPIVAGSSLADLGGDLARAAPVLHAVRHPVLLVPFVAAAAAQAHTCLRLDWPDLHLTLDPDLRIEGSRAALLAPLAPRVACGPGPAADGPQQPGATRAHLSPDTYARLDALARRTYAPATAASRAGAGAGLSDND